MTRPGGETKRTARQRWRGAAGRPGQGIPAAASGPGGVAATVTVLLLLLADTGEKAVVSNVCYSHGKSAQTTSASHLTEC